MTKRWLSILIAVFVVVVLGPSYVRAYRVMGASDAPTYLVGDRVLVNRAAYDVRLPYTDVAVVSLADPEVGDIVLYRSPGSDRLVLKRVVGAPGDLLAMNENHLSVNGTALEYADVDDEAYSHIAATNQLGAVIETESGHGPAHAITYTPGGSCSASFDPVRVPDRHYYLLGDNRDHSEDSRSYGPVPRERILGKVGLRLTSTR